MAELMNNKVRFDNLRKTVMKAIAKEFEEDGYGKSYEGTFEWTTCYPNYYDDPDGTAEPEFYVLELHCYVLGPFRHYRWTGKTREEVLDAAEKEILSWLN